jgi:prepilin-type N-terminal cleavage/methylation domain-containing protein
MTNQALRSSGGRDQAGFTLIEMMLTMGLTLIIMASTMGAMNNAIRASETATLVTNMNASLRTAIDIMVRDMLQVGQGLPSGRIIDIPQGTGGTAVKVPGAPGTLRTLPLADSQISAIIPGPGLGPTINGVATDVITVLEADGAFLSTISGYNVNLTFLDATKMTVDPAVDISNGGADDLHVGDLIMLSKATSTSLVQITSLDGVQTAFFAVNDSLNLNQTAAATGTLTAHVNTVVTDIAANADPTTHFYPSTATRIRLISYYLDATTDPNRPRLVRRVNNGSATTYDNSSGTAVAFDVENLQITYDLVDGINNPAWVKMNAADLAGTGACSPNPCSPNNIRKINISISGRSRTTMRQTRQYFRNTLTTQVSLRSMSFMDKYK